jgi:ribosome-associated protein
MVRINDQLSIPANELSFELSTSSGPGGQHVNRTQTRVTLLFHLAASQTLNESQKSRLFEHLAGRIDRQGRVRVRCGRHRSQSRNREETLERFAAIVAAALKPRVKRRPTKVSKGAKRRRLDEKQRRGKVKSLRRRPGASEE